ncbi:hypothetical protein N7532_002654 [Penicillium argentinense]|uniref:Uncharacterized protein n=1 Tax=Penicillium argentinense TaxID=1131581 RepID=A0A9W9KKF3_9EURO|nr:uncharacterized protein N7532_002654 [Penicillium argentinense]KAJ5110009.1 hypothetical protein N7532_002654 [Penicillium argentinense]
MAARFSPDSRRLAIVSKIEKDEIPDGMAIKIEDLSLTSRPHYIYLDVGSVNSIAFSPDSLLLAVICYPGIVFILDVTYGDLLKTIDPDSNYQNQRQYNYIEIFGFSPRGRVQEPHPMSEDRPKRGISRLWSAMKGKSPKAPIVESPTQSQTCESRTDKYAFSPDGRILTIDPDDWYFCDEHPPHFELPSSLLAEGYRSYCLFLDTPPGKSNRKPSLRLEYTTNGSSDENAASSSPDNTEICVEGENDEWVTFRGHSILWLPPEYRPFRRGSDSVVWATYKNILAMGHKSGQVTFIKFDLPFEGLSSCAGRTRAEVVHRPSRGAVYK